MHDAASKPMPERPLQKLGPARNVLKAILDFGQAVSPVRALSRPLPDMG